MSNLSKSHFVVVFYVAQFTSDSKSEVTGLVINGGDTLEQTCIFTYLQSSKYYSDKLCLLCIVIITQTQVNPN